MTRTKLFLFAAAISMFLITSCGKKETLPTDNQQVITVKTGKTAGNQSGNFLNVTGKTEAEESANISTRMMGYVTRVNVKTGQKVSQGTVLININSSDLEAKRLQVASGMIQAEAAYENAKKDKERFENLFKNSSVTRKELDDMLTRYEMAKAGLSAAQQMQNEINSQFAYLTITAPFSGTITNTFVKAGDMANPGMPLLSIEGNSRMQVSAMIPESEISLVKSGQKAEVNIKSLDVRIPAVISEISTSAKNTGGQYLIKLDLEKYPEQVKAGMFAGIKIETGVIPNEGNENPTEIMVPVSAIFKRGQLSGIYVVSDKNIALLRWIRTGKSTGDMISVESGLSANETYILEAAGRVYNGAQIKISN